MYITVVSALEPLLDVSDFLGAPVNYGNIEKVNVEVTERLSEGSLA